MKAILWAIIGLLVYVLFVMLLNAALSKAHAHDLWINNSGYRSTVDGTHCCGQNDCEHFTEGQVQHVAGGYLIRSTGELVPDVEAQVGEDNFYWRCKRSDGSRRCFFTPTGGV